MDKARRNQPCEWCYWQHGINHRISGSASEAAYSQAMQNRSRLHMYISTHNRIHSVTVSLKIVNAFSYGNRFSRKHNITKYLCGLKMDFE